jgi:very-short-patch-repair endonuclease
MKPSHQQSFASHPQSHLWSNKNPVKPTDVFRSSRNTYEFKCDICNHEFSKILNNISENICPYCVIPSKLLCNNKECNFCFDKSFAPHEKAKYWSNKNKLNPREVSKNANKKYFFDCPDCKHEFEIALNNLNGKEQFCPYCAIPTKILCSNDKCKLCFNKSFASHEKARYWSKKNNINPRDVIKGTPTKYLFDCKECNHVIDISLSGITTSNHWCSYCTNQKLCNNDECKSCFNKSFASSDKAIYWSNKNVKKPREEFKSSKHKFWFCCNNCKHDIEIELGKITAGGWCSYCASKNLCDYNNCNFCFDKSFASHEKAKYWSKKNSLLPREVTKFTNKKYYFDCPDCKLEFSSVLSNISGKNQWCPKCKNKTEKKIIDNLHNIYKRFIHQYNVEWCKNIKTNHYFPFDFCIQEYNIIIELDGIQHFKQVSNWKSPEEVHNRDLYKLKCANNNNHSVIRLLQEDVFYDKYDWLSEIKSNIEKIVIEKKIQNIFMCKNDEYKIFDKIDYNLINELDLSDENDEVNENILN